MSLRTLAVVNGEKTTDHPSQSFAVFLSPWRTKEQDKVTGRSAVSHITEALQRVTGELLIITTRHQKGTVPPYPGYQAFKFPTLIELSYLS